MATEQSTENSDGGNERRECIEDGCTESRERVITLYGGVAPVCDEHAEERLEHPDAIDNTAYFKGEREEPITGQGGSRSA